MLPLAYLAMKHDPEFNEFIYNEIGNEEETNEQFLYITNRNRIAYGTFTVENIISQYLDQWNNGEGQNNGEYTVALNEDNIFETILEYTPLITISIPDTETCNYDLWNGELIGVAVRQNCTDDAYWEIGPDNEEGEIKTEDPVKPVLTVLDSEVQYLVNSDSDTHWGTNIMEFMPTSFFPFSITNCELFIQALQNGTPFSRNGRDWTVLHHDEILAIVLECLDLLAPTDDEDDDPCACERDCETSDEILVDFKINGWGVYQNIKNFLFETKFVFHADFMGIERTSSGAIIQRPNRFVSGVQRKRSLLNCSNGPCQGRWVSAGNFRLWSRDWKVDELASPYAVAWSEVDNRTVTSSLGATVSAKFVVDGVEITQSRTFTLGTQSVPNVPLGSGWVEYCDPLMMENSTGSITFRVN